MRTIATLLFWAFCCVALFIVGVLATFQVNILIYGAAAFDGDEGAKLTVLIEGIFIGLLFAVSGIPIGWFLSERIPLLREEPDAPHLITLFPRNVSQRSDNEH